MTTKWTPDNAGCIFAGHRGRYIFREIVDLALLEGWQPSQPVNLDDEPDSEQMIWASEEAEDWLNDNVAPEGYHFGWWEGEFFLQPDSWWLEEDEEDETED